VRNDFNRALMQGGFVHVGTLHLYSIIRRCGFHWRYDTKETSLLLNELWPLVDDRLNYLNFNKETHQLVHDQ